MSMSITVVGRCPDLELQLGNCRLDIRQQLRVIDGGRGDTACSSLAHIC